MSETELKDTAPEQSTDTVSTRLLQAREAKGLSQKEVADELFLTTTFIRYIDEGDFDKIPKPAFIKGYLRSYARVVGLDGDALVTAFEQEQDIAPQTPKIVDVTERAEPPSGLGGSLVQTGLAGLALLILVAIVVWWIAGGDEPAPTATSISQRAAEQASGPVLSDAAVGDGASIGAESVKVPSPDANGNSGSDVATMDSGAAPVSAAADRNSRVSDPEPMSSQSAEPMQPPAAVQASVDENVAAPVPTSIGNNDDAPLEQMTAAEAAFDEAQVEPALAADNAIVQDAPDVQIERVSEGGTNFISVYAGGDSTIEFEFTDECWVEIRDGEGAQIYADLNRPGDVMTVYGQRPFDVLLGRAPGVEMAVDGESVNLARFTTRDETARVRTARL